MQVCVLSSNPIFIVCIRFVFIIIGVVFGVWLLWQPKKSIDMQIAFYRLINCKIETISLAREIRNTRIMGASLLIITLCTIIFLT
jgi:hypothetical protein